MGVLHSILLWQVFHRTTLLLLLYLVQVRLVDLINKFRVKLKAIEANDA